MSKFELRKKTCPQCGAVAEREVAVSINGGRFPRDRALIIEEKFQAFRCAACGRTSLVEDPFMYTDFQRKDWIGVFPTAWELEWSKHERAPADAFALNMKGAAASPTARELAAGFRVRAVFGLGALREKLLCTDSGIDDLVLEVLKLELMRTTPPLTLHPGGRPRLAAADEDTLRFHAPSQQPSGEWTAGELAVPRAAYDRIARDPSRHEAAMRPLRDAVYLDVGRILIEG